MIPKKIHYCWFGEKEPGELEQKCIESWKKILPDYELRFWGNDCLDRFDNKYLRQAVEAKKWAFVSDYVRLYALLEEGGLYFDTDEEVVRRLDEFMEHDFFIGSQRCGTAKEISPALIGAVPHSEIIKNMLEVYDYTEFVNPDGSYNMTPNPKYFRKVLLEKYGIKNTYVKKGRVQICENAFIYPYTNFCTSNKDAYAIHHYSGCWRPAWRVREKFSFRLGNNLFSFRKYKFKVKHGADEPMPLKDGEKIVFSFRTSKQSQFMLIKKQVA